MILTLNLKGEYFDQIKSGEKIEEYRLFNPYWRKRLEHRRYDKIHLKRGYPSKNDKTRLLVLPWRGHTVKIIQHNHFGVDPVEVFAIRVAHNNKPASEEQARLFNRQ